MMDVVNGARFGAVSRMLGVITCAVVLVACGGGGGGSKSGENPPPTVSKPVVNAGADITVNTGQRVDLDPKALVANNTSANLNAQGLEIKGSSETKEHIVHLVWAKTEGPDIQISSSGFNDGKIYFIAPSTNGAASIKITFKLTLTNAGGLSAEDTVTITVNRVNKAPTANAGDDIDSLSGDTVKLNASLSNDADGSIAKYLWEQISGETVVLDDTQAAQPSFVAPQVTEATTLEFKLTVEDNEGKKSDDAVQVVVKPGDAPNLAMHFPPAAGIYTESTLSLFGVVAAKGGAGITSLTVDVGNGPAAVEVSENGEWRIDGVSLPVGVAQIAIAVEATDSEGRKAVVHSQLQTSTKVSVGTGQSWDDIVGIDVDSSTNKLWIVTLNATSAKLMSVDLKNGNRSATVSDLNNAAQGVSPLLMASMMVDEGTKQVYLSSAEKMQNGSYGNGQILGIDTASGNRQIVSDASFGGGTKLGLPWGMVMGESGELFVADNANNSIVSVNVGNGDRTVIADVSTTPYDINAPKLLSKDNADKDRLFVANAYEVVSDTYVYVFDLDLKVQPVTTGLVVNGMKASSIPGLMTNGIQNMAVDTENDLIFFNNEFGSLVAVSVSSGEASDITSGISSMETFAYDEVREVLYVIDDFPEVLYALDPWSGSKVIISKPNAF
ncbi:MAG TPA: hypothetical protein VL995_17505 [Cellvibrio sp.]|nr:hypothetical protein [Cellvibrio sp.]